MSIDIIFFHGNTQENDSYAGKSGSITIDTESKSLRIHDGLTFGGHRFQGSVDPEEIRQNLDIDSIPAIPDALSLKLAADLLGALGGVATLDGSGLVPASQLPTYIDDVITVASVAEFPLTGEVGKLYLAADTSFAYRWTGSLYMLVTSPIGSTDELTEGSVNLFYSPARVRDAFEPTENVTYDPMTGMFGISLPVKTVGGKTGDVVLDGSDVGLGEVANFPMATAQQMSDMDSAVVYASPVGPRLALGELGIVETEHGWLAVGEVLAMSVMTEDGLALTAEDGVVLDFEIF